MQEIQTSKGILKYRMPNIIDAYDLIEASGIANGVASPLKLKRNIIAGMAFLIDFSGIEGANSYDDILNDVENMTEPLGKIAEEFVVKTFEVFKKKSS